MKYQYVTSLVSCLILLSACVKEPLTTQNAPALLEEIHFTIAQRYALMQDKNINWDSLYNEFSKRVSDGTTDPQLFRIANDMLEQLKDGHVALFSPFDSAAYGGYYTLYPRNFNMDNIRKFYLKNSYSVTGPWTYKTENGIGYIHIATLKEKVTASSIDNIFDQMQGTIGLILDLRDNQGGKLELARDIASRFYKERLLAKYEQVKTGPAPGNLSEPQPFYIDPSTKPYNGKLVLITNRTCYSACNDLVMFLKRLPGTTQVGDQTGGGGAIPFDFILRNGWRLQYSGSRTSDYQMRPVEQGIKPHITVSITPLDEQAGKDPILEKAISLIK